jgi:flagellar biosynthetic protein FliO
MRIRTVLVLIAVFGFLPALGLAQSAQTPAAPGTPMMQLDSVGPLVLRLILTLAAVVALIFGTVWVLKRLTVRRWPGATQSRPIRVLERVHLAPKRSLDVVAIGERVILLGVTETGITFLTELSPQERGQLQPPEVKSAPFKSVLGEAKDRMRQAFTRARTELPGSAVVPVGTSAHKGQVSRS